MKLAYLPLLFPSLPLFSLLPFLSGPWSSAAAQRHYGSAETACGLVRNRMGHCAQVHLLFLLPPSSQAEGTVHSGSRRMVWEWDWQEFWFSDHHLTRLSRMVQYADLIVWMIMRKECVRILCSALGVMKTQYLVPKEPCSIWCLKTEYLLPEVPVSGTWRPSIWFLKTEYLVPEDRVSGADVIGRGLKIATTSSLWELQQIVLHLFTAMSYIMWEKRQDQTRDESMRPFAVCVPNSQWESAVLFCC